MPVPPRDVGDDIAKRDPATPVAVEHTDDLALAREILAGSASAWDQFVRRYAGLLWAVIRRYLPAHEREEAHTIFADLLSGLYQHKLATYEGRASLSTWLTLVARTQAVDHLRHRFGRRALPRGLRRLGDTERDVFRWYYVEGLGFREVLRQLTTRDASWTSHRLVTCLQQIEDQVDDRSLRRIAYDLHAQSTGASSGRLLAYLDHVRGEFKLYEGAHRPEYHVMEREARRILVRLRELIDQLPAEDRQVYTLRFERGWSAQQIAEELGLQDTRVAYTLIDRLKRVIRRQLSSTHDMEES
jgi:RNA polymerase sigma-70 factor (ECF subfamily)